MFLQFFSKFNEYFCNMINWCDAFQDKMQLFLKITDYLNKLWNIWLVFIYIYLYDIFSCIFICHLFIFCIISDYVFFECSPYIFICSYNKCAMIVSCFSDISSLACIVVQKEPSLRLLVGSDKAKVPLVTSQWIVDTVLLNRPAAFDNYPIQTCLVWLAHFSCAFILWSQWTVACYG